MTHTQISSNNHKLFPQNY